MRSFRAERCSLYQPEIDLVAMFRELEQLREQVRIAELARSLRADRRKRTHIRRLEHRRPVTRR